MENTRRKRIGLFVSFPETVHVRRITEGIRRRCELYGYDMCVFASSVHVAFPMNDYMLGESSIYELANFDELDGVILDHTTLKPPDLQRHVSDCHCSHRQHASPPYVL